MSTLTLSRGAGLRNCPDEESVDSDIVTEIIFRLSENKEAEYSPLDQMKGAQQMEGKRDAVEGGKRFWVLDRLEGNLRSGVIAVFLNCGDVTCRNPCFI